MEWYWIVLIVFGSIFLIGSIIVLCAWIENNVGVDDYGNVVDKWTETITEGYETTILYKVEFREYHCSTELSPSYYNNIVRSISSEREYEEMMLYSSVEYDKSAKKFIVKPPKFKEVTIKGITKNYWIDHVGRDIKYEIPEAPDKLEL